MPIHDWTRVVPGTFHAFHGGWTQALQGAPNNGVLPPGFYALAEKPANDAEPDVLTFTVPGGDDPTPTTEGSADGSGGGLAVRSAPPRASVQDVIGRPAPATARARRLVIRHTSDHEALAMVEVVSPGNKRRRVATTQFVDEALSAIEQGLRLQVLDPFPPGRSDPMGLHAVIWSELGGDLEPPRDRPLTLAPYVADTPARCYVEPPAVGMALADLPLFLSADRYVNVPLERTYTFAYETLPRCWREVIEGRRQA